MTSTITHCLNNRLPYSGEAISLTRRPRFTPQKEFLVLISVPDWVNSRDTVRLQGLGKLKKRPISSSGFEPSTLYHNASTNYATVSSVCIAQSGNVSAPTASETLWFTLPWLQSLANCDCTFWMSGYMMAANLDRRQGTVRYCFVTQDTTCIASDCKPGK
jgi:hypothetical protein